MLWFWCVLRFGKHSSYNHFRFWCEEFLNFWVYHHFLDCCLGLVIGIAKTLWFACLKPKLFLAKQYAFYKFCIFSCSKLCKSMFSVALWYLQCNQQNRWIPVLTTHNAHDLFQKKSLYTWFPYWKDVKIPIQITMHCQISFFFQLRPCTFPFMFGRYPLKEAQVMDLIGTPSICRSNIFVRFWYSLVRTFIIWTITVAPLTQLQSLFCWEEANLTTAQHHIFGILAGCFAAFGGVC